ncbi:MAG: hypothetical protein JST81_08350 [Bacteroidetes bacterium]|nr:hypothetical protein [Bacteroidota bacterium]
MKSIIFLSVFFLVVSQISCTTNSNQDSRVVHDTVYVKVPDTAGIKTFNDKAYNAVVLWEDFKTDSIEYENLKKKCPDLANSKTVAVRYDIAALKGYLDLLQRLSYKNIDVFIGRYPDRSTYPGTGTIISPDHSGRLTVLFAGEGMSKEVTPNILPYNVGNPWP